MVWTLKQYASGMESDRTGVIISIASIHVNDCAYPITRSNCCCRIFVETLQFTRPVVRVIAKASAMSRCIDSGILEFFVAHPTQISDDVPRCSNSLAAICAMSAPHTNDKTTFVGNRWDRYSSMPRAEVVLRRMHVCCGETTD
jgi:hypothetical protein